MDNKLGEKIKNSPSKGGIIGALIGALSSAGYHKQGEKPIRQAGRTVLFSGTGFLIGHWIESLINRKS